MDKGKKEGRKQRPGPLCLQALTRLSVVGSPVDEGDASPLVLEAELLVSSLLALRLGLGLRLLLQLEGPGVARLPLRALNAPLIGLWGRAGVGGHQVNGWAIGLEGYGLGGTPVVLQALWVDEVLSLYPI